MNGAFPATGHSENRLVFLFFMALFSFGVAWSAILPPYEGMDEIGHYASIRHVAETLRIPFPGSSFLPQETMDYGRIGPLPYKSGDAVDSGRTQFNGLSYAAFFSEPERAKAYEKQYRSFEPHTPYAPSTEDNWQTQQPPLYYLLMAPLMKATDGLPFVMQFFILRAASFLLAIGGMAIGLRASLARTQPESVERKWIIRAYLLYPLLVPIFIEEFARLGNDSLCLLLTGLLWSSFLRWLDDETKRENSLMLGAIFGLGLLTKALFLPLLGGFVAFLALRMWRNWTDIGLRQKRIEAIKAFMLPVNFCGLWYIYKLKAFGVLSGSVDEVYLAQHGGFVHNLLAHFSWASLGSGGLITLLSWFWGGTASQIGFNPFFALPFALLTICVAGIYSAHLRTASIPEAMHIQAWLYGALFIGLFYFQLVCVALDGIDRAPGWYLNIMLPFAAPVYALGLQTMERRKIPCLLAKSVMAYAVLFIAANAWADLTLYTACSVPEGFRYHFLAPLACLGKTNMIEGRLRVLALPGLAKICLWIGLVCMTGSIYYWRSRRHRLLRVRFG